jgi:hypothetical protein
LRASSRRFWVGSSVLFSFSLNSSAMRTPGQPRASRQGRPRDTRQTSPSSRQSPTSNLKGVRSCARNLGVSEFATFRPGRAAAPATNRDGFVTWIELEYRQWPPPAPRKHPQQQQRRARQTLPVVWLTTGKKVVGGTSCDGEH